MRYFSKQKKGTKIINPKIIHYKTKGNMIACSYNGSSYNNVTTKKEEVSCVFCLQYLKTLKLNKTLKNNNKIIENINTRKVEKWSPLFLSGYLVNDNDIKKMCEKVIVKYKNKKETYSKTVTELTDLIEHIQIESSKYLKICLRRLDNFK